MSEEQEIISCLEGLKAGFKLNHDLNQYSVANICNYIDKAISLIEKQQKEILHWKGQYYLISRKINKPLEDKIKHKIKELEKECEKELLTTWLESKIDILQELLEEEKGEKK